MPPKSKKNIYLPTCFACRGIIKTPCLRNEWKTICQFSLVTSVSILFLLFNLNSDQGANSIRLFLALSLSLSLSLSLYFLSLSTFSLSIVTCYKQRHQDWERSKCILSNTIFLTHKNKTTSTTTKLLNFLPQCLNSKKCPTKTVSHLIFVDINNSFALTKRSNLLLVLGSHKKLQKSNIN